MKKRSFHKDDVNVTFRLKYEGEWKNGEWNGNGKLTLNFGDVHEGEFVDNVAQGDSTNYLT